MTHFSAGRGGGVKRIDDRVGITIQYPPPIHCTGEYSANKGVSKGERQMVKPLKKLFALLTPEGKQCKESNLEQYVCDVTS